MDSLRLEKDEFGNDSRLLFIVECVRKRNRLVASSYIHMLVKCGLFGVYFLCIGLEQC